MEIEKSSVPDAIKKDDLGWKKMGFSNSQGIPFINSSTAQLNFSLLEVFQKNRKIILILVGTAAILLIAGAFMSPDEEASEDPLFLTASGKEVHPVDLRRTLSKISKKAKKIGATAPLTTSFEIIEDQGIEFIWSKANVEAAANKASKTTLTENAKAPPSDFDPFDADGMDMRLFIADVPPDHSLILNKFNTMTDHALLVTKEWQSQSWILTPQDLTSLYNTITALPAVGFYNSGAAAGASQAHKHMQMIPLDVLKSYRPTAEQPIPIDGLIFEAASSHQAGEVFTLPNFDFKHGIVMFSKKGLKSWRSEHLFDEYQNLLVHTNLISEAEDIEAWEERELENYNLLMTENWMMIVPRSQRKYLDIDVNAMGFIGCLLTRTQIAEDSLESHGPLHILSNVGLPK